MLKYTWILKPAVNYYWIHLNHVLPTHPWCSVCQNCVLKSKWSTSKKRMNFIFRFLVQPRTPEKKNETKNTQTTSVRTESGTRVYRPHEFVVSTPARQRCANYILFVAALGDPTPTHLLSRSSHRRPPRTCLLSPGCCGNCCWRRAPGVLDKSLLSAPFSPLHFTNCDLLFFFLDVSILDGKARSFVHRFTTLWFRTFSRLLPREKPPNPRTQKNYTFTTRWKIK